MPSQQGRETIVNQPPQPPYQGQPQPPFEGPPPGQPPQQWQQPPAPQQQWPQQPQPQPQWDPQQQWPQQPQQAPPPPGIPGPGVGTHLKRAIDWNLAEIVPTPREVQALDAAGIEPRLRGMLVWRRSLMLVALPVLLLSVVLAFVEASDVDTTGFTGFGKLWNFLPAIALLFQPLAAMRVISIWTDMRRSSRTLIICWVISIAVPLFTALVPLTSIIDVDAARQSVQAQGGDVAAFDAEILTIRLLLAVNYAMYLLPVVVTVPGGVLKGAARIKSLFPAASLPGWFLVGVAPFYSLFTIVVFVLIEQVIGNGLLLVGVGLVAFSPWLFVIYRKVYGRPLSVAEARTELAKASRWGGVLLALGLVLIAIFVLTAEVQPGLDVAGSDSNKSVFTYLQVLRTVAEVFSRSLVTTVVFSAIVLGMVFAEWRTMTAMRPDIREEHDSQMKAIERYMHNPSSPAEATWAAPPSS
jgi:hypothetical protein